MICPSCRYQLPAGSQFCPECGTRVSLAPTVPTVDPSIPQQPSVYPAAPQVPTYKAPSVKAQPSAYPPPSYTPPAAPNPSVRPAPVPPSYMPPVKKKSGKNILLTVFTVILAILLLGSLVLNAIQYFMTQEEIASLESTVDEQRKTISNQEKTIDNQKTSLETLQAAAEHQEADAENYRQILELLEGADIGYAADNFNSSDSILILNQWDSSAQFTLTANWTDGGTVSMELSDSYVADVDFDSNEWSTSTTMTVYPYSPGVCVATFSNNVDNNVFKVLIIVTE